MFICIYVYMYILYTEVCLLSEQTKVPEVSWISIKDFT